MIWVILLLFLLVIAGLGYVYFSRKTPSPSTAELHGTQTQAVLKTAPVAPSQKYWGKQFVVPNPDTACAAAKAIQGRAYAINQTPLLPLTDCSAVQCECHFVSLVDLRSGDERRHRHERREDIRFDTKVDRRSGTDRRTGDHYSWHYTA
jgi:hypothetical protein